MKVKTNGSWCEQLEEAKSGSIQEKMAPSAIAWITWRISGNKPKSGVFLAAAHFSLLTAGFLAVTPIGVYLY